MTSMTSANLRSRAALDLLSAARRLDALGFVPARDGNLSARLDSDRVLITETGVRKRELAPSQLVLVDHRGAAAGGGRPSTELGLHLAVYRCRPDVNAIVHAHPPTATGFACAGMDLSVPLVSEAVTALGPVPLTPYASPGTPEIEKAVQEAAASGWAFLLANHGAVTLGTSMNDALDRMETLEHVARITLVAQLLGGGVPLTPGQVAALFAPPSA